MDITQIRQMEEQPGLYWRSQALKCWRLYMADQLKIRQLKEQVRRQDRPLRRFQLESGNYRREYRKNLLMVRELRRQNRLLRALIVDIKKNDH